MPVRSSKAPEFADTARHATEKAPGGHLEASRIETPGEGKNPHAVALGRLGGLKGGKARAEKLSKAKRRKIAMLAAKARWHGK